MTRGTRARSPRPQDSAACLSTSTAPTTEQREGEWMTRGTRARSPRPKASAACLSTSTPPTTEQREGEWMPRGTRARSPSPQDSAACLSTSTPQTAEQREGEWLTRGTRARSPRPTAWAARLSTSTPQTTEQREGEWTTRGDSSPLAEADGLGGVPEHVDPANDRAARGSVDGDRDGTRARSPRPTGLGGVPEHVDPANDRAAARELAGSTGLEPAASGVTGRRSNQLNYDPEREDLRIGLRSSPPGCHTAGGLASEGWWAVQDSNL